MLQPSASISSPAWVSHRPRSRRCASVASTIGSSPKARRRLPVETSTRRWPSNRYSRRNSGAYFTRRTRSRPRPSTSMRGSAIKFAELLASIESLRGNLLRHEADEEHYDAEHDEEHG